MKVVALKFFISAAFGNVDKGRVFDVSDAQAKNLMEVGLVEIFCSKIPGNSQADGQGDQNSSASKTEESQQKDQTDQKPGASSQADQASDTKTTKTSKKSNAGAKKGSKKK